MIENLATGTISVGTISGTNWHWEYPPQYPPVPTQPVTLITNYPKKEDKNMMGLYEVTAINTKENKELFCNRVIANSEDKAKIKAAKGFDKDIPDEVEFFVCLVGQWEEKKPKEVKIVKE